MDMLTVFTVAACTYVCRYVCAHLYVCMYMYMCTCINTYMYVKISKWGLGCNSVDKSVCLTCLSPWSPSPELHKLDVMVQTCNPSIEEPEVGELEDQGHPQIHSKFKARHGYTRPFLHRKKSNCAFNYM